MVHQSSLLAAFMFLFLQSFSQAGSIDHSFGQNGVTRDIPERRSIRNIVVQQDGKTLGFGYQTNKSFSNFDGFLARYNPDGTLDKSFGNGGMLTNARLNPFFDYLIALQGDGKILVTHLAFTTRPGTDGYSEGGDDDIVITRLKRNGDIDSTFGKDGQVVTDVGFYGPDGNYFHTHDQETSIAVQNDGKILVAVMTATTNADEPSVPRGALIRYNPNGSVDSVKRFYTEFAQNQESYPVVNTYPAGGYVLSAKAPNNSTYLYSTRFGEKKIAYPGNSYFFEHKSYLLANDKIAVLTGYYNDPSFLVVLQTDGNLDTKFAESGYLQVVNPYSVTSVKDNKIILGSEASITRYTPEGKIDKSFGIEGHINNASGARLVTFKQRLYSLNGNGTVAAYILSTEPRSVKVNLTGNANLYNHGEWNNWDNLQDRHCNNFFYSDSTLSSIDAVMSYRNGVNNNGANY